MATATATAPGIAVSDAATIHVGSDRYAATVIAATPASVTVQEDSYEATPDSDYFGNQEYTYTRNPDGRTMTFTRRKNGGYILKGADIRANFYVTFGDRSTYFDPSF